MGVVVDTNVFLNAEHARRDLSLFFDNNERFYMAAVTVSELLAGVALAKNASVRIRRLTWSEAIIETLPVLPFDLEVARAYAEIYAHQLRNSRRQSLSVHDLQIAATAITHDYAVLTNNTKDFEKIPGLCLLSP
ncbi:PIN domain-containing protein [Candidatus Thiosymbion oneisti]|uniref:PIN domain-containing protein n=1 Tax=Candidatus Thiosymbion oneisti TaxID=589554 RepID=UPI000B7FF5F4|nr:PIN domain-containing protein [Candidatus Thiosymbion oneisti]